MRMARVATDVPNAPPTRPLRSPKALPSPAASSRPSSVYPEALSAAAPPPRAGVGGADSGGPAEGGPTEREGISKDMARPESAASLIVNEAIGSVQLQNQCPDRAVPIPKTPSTPVRFCGQP